MGHLDAGWWTRAGARRTGDRNATPDLREGQMANAWFETVAEAQRRAKKRLPPSVYRALIAGSEKGLTLSDNIAAFSELGFAPRVDDLVIPPGFARTLGAGHRQPDS
jgi:hypothetical protein